MLLVVDGNPRGVRCDITGKELFDKFTYYSLEGKIVSIDTSRKIANRETEVTLDLDLCEAAYDELYEKVKSHLGPIKAGVVKCDLSDRYMTGVFQYWAISVAQVQVDLEQQEAMSINKGIFDLNISADEALKLVQKRDEHRARPVLTPKQVPKKETPAPATPDPQPAAAKPAEKTKWSNEPEVELEPQEIVKPKAPPRNVKKKS